MRNALVQMPEYRTAPEQRRALRAAIRQLERADIYLAAVAYMDLGDGEADRATARLRTDLDSLRRHLSDQRARIQA
jgi:nucleoside 2-deoxyribosyltransferase